ncbi:MAG: PAS domain S-box protein [Chitinophagaceae bacterium]
MEKKSSYRWYNRISIARKLYFTVGIMAALIALELAVLFFSISTLSSVRAYVGGEGLWSKAQKDAMYQLQKYSRTHDEADYKAFLLFMKVPMGDHKALAEMNKKDPDMEITKQGFVEGRNHPEDVQGMVRLFRYFHKNRYIHRAIEVWTAADNQVADFIPIGQKLHDEINSPAPSPQRINEILSEIDPINAKLTVLEDEFSYTLGEGSRWLENLVLKVLFGVALLVECTGLGLAIAVSRGIQKGLNEILLSAQAVTRGDFSRKAQSFSGDEIGKLAISFNTMSEALEKSISKTAQEQHKFKGLLESAPDAIVIADEAGIIQLANNQCEPVFGYKSEELLGNAVELLIPSRFRSHHPKHRERYSKDAQFRPMHVLVLQGKRKNGEEFPVEISLSPLQTDEGLLVMAAIRDISEKKRLENELRDAYNLLEKKVQQRTAELESKNKELEQFAYVASHDLQEPLRTTSSFVELLRKQYRGKLDPTADKYLDYILHSSDRMKILIKDLLDYSRIGREKEIKQVDCNLILADVLADLDKVIKENDAEIHSEVLPVVSAYPTELKLMFQNLISNSIKFKKQGVKPVIEIRSYRENGFYKFSVQDNGIGLEPQHRQRIFIIFQRLHNRSEYEGSGIGLAHCKKIAELHGGQIWVDAEPGEGCTFFFTIIDHKAGS